MNDRRDEKKTGKKKKTIRQKQNEMLNMGWFSKSLVLENDLVKHFNDNNYYLYVVEIAPHGRWNFFILYTMQFYRFLSYIFFSSRFTKNKGILFAIVCVCVCASQSIDPWNFHAFHAINVEHLNMQTLNENVIQKFVAFVFH